jgi:hypothetical protein
MQRREHSDFYCYALLRPDGTPFYVGKGRGGRVRGHTHAAINGERSPKADIIRSILRQSGHVDYMYFADHLTASQALCKEIEMIATIGRQPNGPLVNRNDGNNRSS